MHHSDYSICVTSDLKHQDKFFLFEHIERDQSATLHALCSNKSLCNYVYSGVNDIGYNVRNWVTKACFIDPVMNLLIHLMIKLA